MKPVIAVIGGAVIVGVIFSVLAYQGATPNDIFPSDNDSFTLKENPQIEVHDTDEKLTDKEKKAINTVQNFKGDDNAGNTIVQTLGEIISSKYPEELEKPNTKIGWSAYTDPDKPDVKGVVFTFESAKDEFSFLWYVDSKTGTIIPVGDGTKKLMDVLNN